MPSISTAGARNIMQRLCEEADLDIDSEYLKPHTGDGVDLTTNSTRKTTLSSPRRHYGIRRSKQYTKRTPIFKRRKPPNELTKSSIN